MVVRGGTVLGLLVALALAGAAPASAADGGAVEDIVAVLREKGLIDAATGDEILAKEARDQARAAERTAPVSAPALTEGLVWSGDFRLRNEQFWYGRAFGVTSDDNNRFRYRARLGFTKTINSWAQLGFRLASGTGDYRSTNSSFGQTVDFSPDSIAIDRAFVQIALPDPGIGLATTLTAGKIANPFVWKNGIDKLVWDEDINPEGFALTATLSPAEGTKLFATAGYFVELSQSDRADTDVTGLQLGGSTALGEKLTAGARASYYAWNKVSQDATFATRAAAFGNLPTAFEDDVRLAEGTVYLTWTGIEGWPAVVWSTLAENLSAESGTIDGVEVDSEDTAFSVGVEVGDPKSVVVIGLAYQRVEANSVLGLYTDSDMFDGFTNREGFAVWAARQVAPNTELKLSLWEGEPIRTTASGGGEGPYNISSSSDGQANRKRLQADLNFRF